MVRSGKGRRPEDYVAPPREELEKLRKVTPPPARPESREGDSALFSPSAEEKRAPRQQGGRPRQEEQEAPTGRVRKYYRLTQKGKKLLDSKREEWELFRQGVDGVLSGGASALA